MNEMDLIIETTLGKIKGVQKENYQKFLGIRYAKAPVGRLRFQKPRSIESWEGLYDATEYGPIAPQLWIDQPPLKMVESEDCLFLNVFTPQADNNKRPVMFYIHGGAFGIGSGSRPRLYGGNLAKHGNVVVVTIQYRLGVLGFLYMDNVTPNLGLQDVVCALQWIRDNIEAFGGDLNNVTIFGQSAGAMAVTYLMVMPLAKGLFHKAIAQSGSIPLKTSQARGLVNPSKKILSKLKIQSGDLKAMQDLPLEELMRAQKKIIKSILSEHQFYPVLDGNIIPRNIDELMESGITKGIDLIIGYNADELPLFGYYLKSSRRITRFLARTMVKRRIQRLGLRKSAMKQILEVYRNKLEEQTTSGKELDFLLKDVMFRMPAIQFAEKHSSTHSGTYFYTFSYPAPNIGSAVHVLELFFIFKTITTTDISDDMELLGSKEEEELSQKIMNYWINFARKGDPNHPDLPEWPRYDSENCTTMILDVSPGVVERHRDEIRIIWEKSFL